MSDDTPMADRCDERITDDIVRCLRIVNPAWLKMFPDDSTLTLHVRDTLDELEQLARESGRGETGCMIVEHEPETGATYWRITVAYRHDDDDATPATPDPEGAQ